MVAPARGVERRHAGVAWASGLTLKLPSVSGTAGADAAASATPLARGTAGISSYVMLGLDRALEEAAAVQEHVGSASMPAPKNTRSAVNDFTRSSVGSCEFDARDVYRRAYE
jgi:hypothetical protein